MEIIDNKALKLVLRNPDRVTEIIPKSKIVGRNGEFYEVLVHWGHEECIVLKNLGIKNVPSPINKDYKWNGIFKPYDHQKVTAAFLTNHKRAYCLNEMGTGKTSSVLWAADYLMIKGIIRRVLVVCPLSIMHSAWKADAFKTVMHRTVDVAHGSREKRLSIINSDTEIVIINYDGIGIVADAIAKNHFDLIVIDEFNHYKASTSKRWKVMNGLIKSNTWVWGLTGSPASQSPTDAYGLAKLINPSSVPQFFGAFRDMVMHKINQYKYIPRPNAMEVVYATLQPAIRFTKAECLDLPPRTYITRDVPLTAQQRKYYMLMKEQMLIEAAGEEITSVNAAINLNKLIQIAAGSVYSTNKEVIDFDCSNRLEALEEIIEEASKKVIVFATFRHSIAMIEGFLTRKGYTVGVVHGGISVNKRVELFDQFQTTPNPHVLVIQPKSAAHGVTLTAANVIVWWSPTPSVETYAQANDRVHRNGQDTPCTVIHLSGSPVEERFYNTLERKGNLLDGLLNMYKDFLRA